MLTEAVTVTGYHRKAIIRAWRRPVERRARGPRRGRPTRYDAAAVRALRAIWTAAGYPWSHRLKALLPVWLPWARRRLALSSVTEQQVRAINQQYQTRIANHSSQYLATLQARARRLLLKGALVEIALGQQRTLFSEENYPYNFDESAIIGLKRHKSPCLHVWDH
jgi:hypothetical protein